MRPSLLFGIAFTLFCAGSRLEAAGDGTLKAPLVLTTPDPLNLASGDFNGDGKQDLAAVNGTSQIKVLIQDSGIRSRWRQNSYLAGVGVFAVLTADFDGDGADDLTLTDPASQAFCMRSLGDGTFGPAVALPESQYPRDAAVGDFDRDGNLDLALANHDVLTLGIYLGEGTGTFSLFQTYRAAGEPHAIQALDLDGDGSLDLAVGLSERGLQLCAGSGDGTFDLGPNFTYLGCVRGLRAHDFNQDGLGDLVLTCFAQASVATMLPGGNLQVRLERLIASAAAVADVDLDGVSDLITTSYGSSEVWVYPCAGDGNFRDRLTFQSTGLNPYGVIARDLDGDGTTEVVTADRRSASLTLLWGTREGGYLDSCRPIAALQSAKSMALGDLDRDGFPDLFISRSNDTQIQVFLSPGGAAPSGPPLVIDTGLLFSALETPDIDGDGVPDLAGVQLTQGLLLTALLASTGETRSTASRLAGNLPSRVVAGQVDGDGKLDLLVPCSASNHLALFRGQEGGNLSEAAAIASIPRVKDAAVGDFDGDGRTDVAVISTDELAIQFGGADGFASPVRIEQDQSKRFSDVSIADLDGDSTPDLVVLEAQVTGSVVVYEGLAGRQFSAGRFWTTQVVPSGLRLADVDGDGSLDATVLSKSGQALSVLLNRGGSTLPPVSTYRVQTGPLGHRVEDLDADGAPDVVTYSASSAILLRGQPQPQDGPLFVRGDVAGDGQLGLDDSIVLLARLFLGGAPLFCEDAADADDDGELGVADAIAILNRLFLGGALLPPPGPRCGEDPSGDSLAECLTECP